MPPVIRVSNLGKEYIIGGREQAHQTFREMLTHSLATPFRRLRNLRGQVTDEERFWALKDISFEVQQGEVVGIIGRNGAGKSTLLKILSRITEPTEGEVEIRGRVASLLEVGTGFHPELTGRENIYLNGAILGMCRAEIDRNFDEIVAFAEVEKFLDTPVKRYSSGMYVRLAFAVAAHLETDVLLVDEVLAVGDATFQRKSLGKMSQVATQGKTVLFISHNLSAVRNLCTRTLLLEDGGLRFNGITSEALSIYDDRFSDTRGLLSANHFDGPLAEELKFEELVYFQDGAKVSILDPKEAFMIEVRGIAYRDFSSFELNIALYRDGFHITCCFDTTQAQAMRKGPFVSRFNFPSDVLRTGRYLIGIGAYSSIGSWVWCKDVANLDFLENFGGRAPHQLGAVAIPYSAERIQ